MTRRLKMVKICEVCCKEFHPLKNFQKCCSTQCAGKQRSTSLNFICHYCGKEYQTCYSNKDTTKYCSRSCYNKMQAVLNIGANDTQWIDGRSIYHNIAFNEYPHLCNRCGSRHRLEVHHKDRNRKNSLLDNLEILCIYCHKKEHHRKGYKLNCASKDKHKLLGIDKKRLLIENICPVCNNPFHPWVKSQIYCSKKCKGQVANGHSEIGICPTCGKEFTIRKRGDRQSKFCSQSCGARGRVRPSGQAG